MSKKIIARVMSGVLGCSMLLTAFAGCAPKKRDSIVLMAEEMSGLFNPFYATSGADMDVVGMTQIGMLSTDKNGNPVANDEEATVVKAFNFETVGTGDNQQTVYTFVLKNGLRFSDGEPLTMNDVLFNMYVYLDPSYTGSSTMYSTDIVGLREYRLQRSFTDDSQADQETEGLNNTARSYAKTRVALLETIYDDLQTYDGEPIAQEQMEMAIADYDFKPNAGNEKDGYINAVLPSYEQTGKGNDYYREKLLEDYQLFLKTFQEELVADFKAAKEAFDVTVKPYSDHKALFENDIFKFFFYEGIIRPTYGNNGKDKEKIESFSVGYDDLIQTHTTMEQAVEYAYDYFRVSRFNEIFQRFGTPNTLITQYTAEAMDILLHEQLYNEETGEVTGLTYKNIEGIKSLGHSTDVEEVKLRNYRTNDKGEVDNTVEEKTYKVAHTHNANGTPTNADEYDVLQITLNGVDPKAVYNFGFTVAPAHYYGSADGTGNDVNIDITKDEFGVPWADSNFQSKVIQSQRNVEVPMGAGAFQATNANNDTDPKGDQFWSSNIVYFKRNDNFMFKVKAEKLRLQVVSSTNAIGQLSSGAVDYITPQFTTTNSKTLKNMEKDGYKTLSSWQLGYGYVGINAGKIDNIYVRRAIMAAMQVELACEYYDAGTCYPITWPMSKVSWAYPKVNPDSVTSNNIDNGKSWTRWEDAKLTEADVNKTTEEKFPQTIAKIKNLMQQATNAGWNKAYDFTFTIAGASISEHPTYTVFRQAEEILDACGWDVDIQADSQALTKLATGSLEVWAAAWGSTVDPDMYQVYHMDSTATSTFAWGYREIKEGGASSVQFGDEYAIISQLSDLIDQGRETLVKSARKEIYEDAMKLVLDLAVEMPVYQRMTLYAFNSNTVKGFSEDVNPYSSPLEKIWELELVD